MLGFDWDVASEQGRAFARLLTFGQRGRAVVHYRQIHRIVNALDDSFALLDEIRAVLDFRGDMAVSIIMDYQQPPTRLGAPRSAEVSRGSARRFDAMQDLVGMAPQIAGHKEGDAGRVDRDSRGRGAPGWSVRC